MTPLAEHLAAEIEVGGSMRFDEYMERALFDPRHGYYASGRARIGREGDFYTNVSVGRMFGRVLAAQAAEIWDRLDRPADFTIVEQGANDGRLAADVLEALRDDHPRCHEATAYTIVEPFPPLESLQRETLASHSGKVRWTESLEATAPFTGLHLTNEYADALPVRLFVRTGAIWLERLVSAAEGRLFFEDRPALDLPTNLPADAPEGYIAEGRPGGAPWIASIAARLERGMALVIDYGFPREQLYAPWRSEGTFSCYRAHRRDSTPLEDPGEKDLTAHVDFTDLAEAGLAAGLDLAGFADQYHFLVGAATPLLLAMENSPTSPRRESDLRALKTLFHPEMMGTQFKYLALSRGIDPALPLSGFRHSRPAAATLSTSRPGMHRGTEPLPSTSDH